MKVLKNISIAVGVLVALFIVVGLFLPRQWEVSRSLTMAASKERIYAQVANLHNWSNWSPWNGDNDKSLVYTYSGPEEGVGAQQNWTSEKMGTGWLKINKADPQSGITYELFMDMGRFQSSLQGTMAFETMDDQTNVVWTDRGDSGNNIIKRWMSLTMGSMLGGDLEKGLASLKALVEKAEPAAIEGKAEEAAPENADNVAEKVAE